MNDTAHDRSARIPTRDTLRHLALTALFATCVTAGYAASGPAQAEIAWGANGHPFTAYPGISIAAQLDYMQDLGLTSYRVNVSDMGHADGLEELVNEARSRGVDILPVITPDVDLENDSAEELYRASYDLAVSLVSRFKDDIRVWELGNELENHAIIQPCEMRDDGTQYPCEWGPAGGITPLEYHGGRWAKVSAVMKGLSEGAASVDPQIRRAMGTAGWGHIGAFERMRDDGIEWEISVWHLYGDDPEWALKELEKYGRPVWITEFNHPEGSRNGDEAQAEGLEREMNRLAALAERYDVEVAHIYELFDEPYWAPSFEAVMGLVRVVEDGAGGWTVGEVKPAYAAVKQIVRNEVHGTMPRRDCDLKLFGSMQPAIPTQVAYSYCLALGRKADGYGFNDWTWLRKQGQTVANMLISMVTSAEFAWRNGTFALTDDQYVAVLRQTLIGEPPGTAASGERPGAGGVDRQEFATRLISSREFQEAHPLLFPKTPAVSQ